MWFVPKKMYRIVTGASTIASGATAASRLTISAINFVL
jgi:hypothetical protein